jgi:uncharacterized membrane protein
MKSKKMTNIILIVTALTTALITGLLYAYSCSVNIGLGRLPDREYIAAMQSVNRAIQNPLFFISFMGTLFLLPLSTWLNYGQPLTIRLQLLLIASVVYIIGVFGVTMLGNVPLNNALDHFNLNSASAQDITTQRAKFEKPWALLHTIRTVASVICLILVLFSLISMSQSSVEID